MLVTDSLQCGHLYSHNFLFCVAFPSFAGTVVLSLGLGSSFSLACKSGCPSRASCTTLTATCPCHLFFRGFKTAVCPPSNPPNASAGLQGNNSYSYMPLPSVFQGDCRLPGLKPPKRFRRASRQQLLQLHAPAICFSGDSRLPFARPQTRLQGNNSYSYMPLPSVFQGIPDCRLPALKPPKRFRRPPRQQLLQLHVPAICFSGGSRLQFARPQTAKRFQPSRRPSRQQLLQLHAPAICFSGSSKLPFDRPETLQTLPQASKATTLTATCPCHLFFRGFKTAVCPPSNPPQNPPTAVCPPSKPPKRFRRPPRQQLLQLHAPAICFSGGSRLPFARPQTPQTLPQASKASTPQAFQGNNSYSYMPLPSVFQGVQDCRLPGLKPSKRFRRPPRQQLLQLHAPAICFSGRLPFARPQTPQGKNNSYSYMPLPSVFQGVQDCRLPGLKPPKRFRRPPRQQLLQLHAPAICFSGGSRLPFARPQTPQTLPQASKATTLTATCPCHLFFRGFKTAVCPPSNPPNASAGLQGNNSYSYMPLPSVFQGVQDCRLPALKPPKRFRRPPRQQLLQLHAPAIFQGKNSYSYMPLPSVFQGVQDCRLPALKPPKRFRRPPRQQLLQLHAPAICFSGSSRLPFARPPTPQTLPHASKATTLTATCPCHLFFRGFKTAVCPPSNPPNASAGLQGNNSYSYMPLPSVFQGVQDCRLPALKPPKRSRRPPRQQLLQLHAPAICFSGGSRLPFARPQTPQTLPQASKATTLTATCPCHLFFRGFKTAVCPPSNPPNASAGLQGNNSYSYMPLPSVFQGVPDCRLPALKPPKRFQPSRRPPRQQLLQLHVPAFCFSGVQHCRLPGLQPPKRCHPPAGLQGNNSYRYMSLPSVFQEVQDCRLPALKPPKRFRRASRQQLLQLHAPAICFSGHSRLLFASPTNPASRQQLLQLHAPAICFSGDSRLPFARPQTPETLPQASKATTLTATCPCHLFFKGFKTAVCPASNPPNASNPPAGLQGNNSYSYMPLPSVFQGVQDCRLTGLKPSKRFRRPPRQQLLQLHAPAICFSGDSRLPFARPQTPETLPQASKATTLTATCPCHLFFRGFKTAVCPASNPQTLPTLPQAFKATTLTATCPCHLFFRELKTVV